MVTSCCAYGCSYRFKKGNIVGIFRFPKDEDRCRQWIQSIKRKNWMPNNGSRVCGHHFQTGKPSLDKNHPDFVPNVFTFTKQKETALLYEKRLKNRAKKQKMGEVDKTVHEAASALLCLSRSPSGNASTSFHQQNEMQQLPDEMEVLQPAEDVQENISSLHLEINALREEKRNLQAQVLLLHPTESILQNKDNLLLYTGILSKNLFQWIVKISSADIKCTIVSKETQLLIVLMKLKLNLLGSDLASRFNISKRSVQRIFDEWIPLLAGKFHSLIRWPTKKALKKHKPQCFKNSVYKNVLCIIDCTEVQIQRSSGQTARSQTWSNYKHSHTIKFLVAVTPSGHVCFMSDTWGGRVSDKELTLQSGFLELLHPGDVVMADRGFIVEEHFLSRGAKLIVPAFTKGKKQLSKHEVHYSKQVSNVRIHVERVIRQIKRYRILQTKIPITFLKYIDSVTIICAALCNLSPSVVKDKVNDSN